MAKQRQRRERRESKSVAAATKRRRETAGTFESTMYKVPEGVDVFSLKSTKVARIDVIPYVVGLGNPKADEGELYWERTFWAHRSVGVNEEWVVCLARTLKKKCPICEFVAKLQKDSGADEKTVKALRPSKRMLLNVIDMDDDERNIKLWEVSHAYFGKALDEALQSAYEDENENLDGFCDLEGGNYLKLVVEEGFQKRGYSVERVDFKPRKKDLDENIIDESYCLDDLLIIKSYDELKGILLGEESDDRDEPEPAKSRRAAKDDFDDNDPDPDDFGDDDPETDTSRAGNQYDDPDDFGDDDPELEPEPEPERSRARQAPQRTERKQSSRTSSRKSGSRRR